MSNLSSIQSATVRNKNVPKELPTVQLDELPPHIRRIVTDTWLFLQIKVCKPCGRTTEEYNVKTCEKCGYTRIERIFYCVSIQKSRSRFHHLNIVRVYRVGLVRNEIGKLINSSAGEIIKDLLILVFLEHGDITHGEGPSVQCGDGWNPYDQYS